MIDPMKSETGWKDPWRRLLGFGAGSPTKHPGSKIPMELRVSRRRAKNKQARASKRINRG